MKFNTITRQVSETVPGGVYEGIDFHGSPPDEIAERAGWVDMTPEIQAQIDADNVKRESEKQAAKIATFPVQSAVIFRLTMRRNFGEGAEVNRAIDAKAVQVHFISRQVAGTITVQELADASVLERLFEELAAWNGTGETWSLFEQYGSLLP
jgi:hypothetical protein